MVPSPTRKVSCRLTTTYAGFEGESALLEELYRRGLEQQEVGPGLHAGDGLVMAWHHELLAPWQTKRWLGQMRRSLRPNQFLRMIENRWVSGTEQFIDMAAWDACVDPELRPLLSDPRLPVWVGVDASFKRDSTALVACSFDRAANAVVLVAHKIYQPTRTEPLDFERTIEQTLLDWRARFRIMQVRYDPWQMQAVAQHLLRQRLPMEEFPQSIPNLTEASNNLYELISGHNIRLYADDVMRLAVSCAVADESPRGWKISKEKTHHKIDAVIALGMAALGAVQGGIKRAPMRISDEVKAWSRIPQRGNYGGGLNRSYQGGFLC
jgi:phage terminase large subunit-like protein